MHSGWEAAQSQWLCSPEAAEILEIDGEKLPTIEKAQHNIYDW